MLKLFKRKKKVVEEQPILDFPYTVVMKDGRVYKCMGKGYEKTKLAQHISDCVENFKNMYFTSADGGKFILWTQEIDYIKID